MHHAAEGFSRAVSALRCGPRLTVSLLLSIVTAAAAAQPSDTIVVRDALGISFPRRTISSVISNTPLDAWFTGGRVRMPKEGESVRFADGSEAQWRRIVPDSLGWFQDARMTERFVAATLERKSSVRMIIEGMGHDFVYVNGTPRAGNPYQQKDTREAWEPHFDYSQIPVELHQGENLLLFRYTRGRLKIRMYPARVPIGFNTNDVTMPDALVGSALDALGSIVLINTTGASLKRYSLVCTPEGEQPETMDVPVVPETGVRKVAFRIRLKPRAAKAELPVRLALFAGGAGRKVAVDTATVWLRVVGAEEPRKETFVSGTDGSVQYYAVTPPPAAGSVNPPALFLSLHGAGVEALNQAASYAPKKWGYVVAPTNRRPYGFSWEDWGRLDALEVLDLVKKEFAVDEGRVYLTGHSMGGHGTWFMSATYPDKFAAIGPSAGWITFRSYRFAPAPEETSAVQRMLRRSASPSDLFSLADNYRHFGAYIIHGDSDDNVPPQQARMMVDRLKGVGHADFVYHEQPGAGHWWDNSPEPGTDCVDWKPLFDFFARHVRPGSERIRTVEFTTANPGISARDAWLSIDAQEHPLLLSSARLSLNPGLNQVQGSTVNVARIGLDKSILDLSRVATVELDSQKIALRSEGGPTDLIWMEKEKGQWHQSGVPSPSLKGAHRYGTFKEAFRNRMALVYGTAGTQEENAWAFARARYDAERLWYQGNGSVDVLADTEFVPSAEPDRNVVLYGNSRTHRLWKSLLPGCPVTLERDRIDIGGTVVKRPDICCIFVRPRPGSAVASVGVVGGTGLAGMMLSHLVRYLEPGLGLPDLTVFNSDMVTKGDAGIILTGFFGPDWSMGSGEFAKGTE